VFGLISQLAHVELQSPRPSESVEFFKRLLGFTETARAGQSVYLRAWGDAFHHSLVVTDGAVPGITHVGWRTAGEEQLQTAAQRIEAAGLGEGWADPVTGHGRAYRYRTPGGHLDEIFWDVERYRAPDTQRSALPIRPQRQVFAGAAPRQIDHVTLATPHMNEHIAFQRDVLGSRFMECTVMNVDDAEPFFAEVSNNEQGHDIGLIADRSGPGGRHHHVAFWFDQAVDVFRAADALLEAGVQIEFGPGRHGHGENTFLYFREPGGFRIEFFSGGYRNYQPDWERVRWLVDTGGIDLYRNHPAPQSMLEVFPPESTPTASVADGDANPWSYATVS
jgi:catechol 2,3-dioxygenase